MTNLLDLAAEAVAELAPSGKLRASINYGNPALARKDSETGELSGVSVDLAAALGQLLGVPVEHIEYSSARQVVDGARSASWDVAFVAIDPERAKDMDYTAAYLIIEGVYMVRDDSPITLNAQVDVPGNRIAVSGGSAYDLYLTREIKQATLVRATRPTEVANTFVSEGLEVCAGVRQGSELDAARIGGLRLLDENFMEINQAMATLRGLPAAARFVAAFVEEMKSSGFVAQALQNNKVQGGKVAPAKASLTPTST